MLRLVVSILSIGLVSFQPLLARGQSDAKLLNKSTATSLSLAGTVVPVLAGIVAVAASQKEYNSYTHDEGQNKTVLNAGLYLVRGGLIIGPGLGYLYAKSLQRFVIGSSIRLASWGLLRPFAGSSGGVLADFAFIAIIVSGLFDIGNVDNAVERYNRQHGFAGIIKPCYFAHENTAGLSVTMRF